MAPSFTINHLCTKKVIEKVSWAAPTKQPPPGSSRGPQPEIVIRGGATRHVGKVEAPATLSRSREQPPGGAGERASRLAAPPRSREPARGGGGVRGLGSPSALSKTASSWILFLTAPPSQGQRGGPPGHVGREEGRRCLVAKAGGSWKPSCCLSPRPSREMCPPRPASFPP